MWLPSHRLREAAASKNYSRIHIELRMIIQQDPAFRTTEFADAVRYIERQNLPDVIREHDGRAFAERSEWSEQYWLHVLSELMDNFSRARIEHLRELGRYLLSEAGPAASRFPAVSEAGDRDERPHGTAAALPGKNSQPLVSLTTQPVQVNDSSNRLGGVVIAAVILVIAVLLKMFTVL